MTQDHFLGLRNSSAVEIIDYLLGLAVSLRASDIHCDPRDEGFFIRFRIDGEIREMGKFPLSAHEELIARMKILSGTRTDVHFIPQDGRWKADIDQKTFNIRVSFMPTYHGENAVLRILPSKIDNDISFSKLGFSPDNANLIEKVLNRPHGLILVTGPTGSGKTTTLHTCLNQKSKQPLSIITLEDPIEYEISGVRQVHIRHSYGLTFASGLRAAMRQDPDVIMVGEIRDKETAQIAIHTALTGHLVLSTLHTNSAIEAIPRLIDMGVDHFLLASTLKLIIAQRLIRMMCQSCFGLGCGDCLDKGYKGRSVIAEVCEVDAGLSALITSRKPVVDCLDYAMKNGFRSIYADGIEKVEWGITTKDEVLRVLYE